MPHGNTRGLSGMALEGLLERDQRLRAHLTLKARSEPPLRPPVSRSLARLSPLPATPLPMFVQAEGESRRDSGAEHSKKVSARQGPGRGRPGTERVTHPQPLRRSASQSPRQLLNPHGRSRASERGGRRDVRTQRGAGSPGHAPRRAAASGRLLAELTLPS